MYNPSGFPTTGHVFHQAKRNPITMIWYLSDRNSQIWRSVEILHKQQKVQFRCISSQKKNHQKLQKKVCELNLFNLILFYLMRSRQVMHRTVGVVWGNFIWFERKPNEGVQEIFMWPRSKGYFFAHFFGRSTNAQVQDVSPWKRNLVDLSSLSAVDVCRTFYLLCIYDPGKAKYLIIPHVLWETNLPFFCFLYAKWRKLWRHPQGHCVLDKQKSY